MLCVLLQFNNGYISMCVGRGLDISTEFACEHTLSLCVVGVDVFAYIDR